MDARRLVTLTLTLIAAIGGVSGEAGAERLPVRKYTTAEGLASDYIISIYRDSRGFLWFSTRDGLSRFDGRRFVTYGVADGLPTATINGILETRAGAYWVATNGGGLSRFNPRGRRSTTGARLEHRQLSAAARSDDPLFVSYRVGDDQGTNRVNVVYEDRAGVLWVGTDLGLFRVESAGDALEFARVDLPLLTTDREFHGVHALVEDKEGSLWIGGGWGLTRLLPDGRAVVYRVQPESVRDVVDTLLFSDDRQLWVGFRSGLLALASEPASSFAENSAPIVRTLDRSGARAEGPVERARWYGTADGLPSAGVSSLFVSADGVLWAGTIAGVSAFDGHRFRPYGIANGLTDTRITGIASDVAGGLWFGSVAGATRLTRDGLVSYGTADGLQETQIHWLAEDASGNVTAVSGDFYVHRFDGLRFESVRPTLPADARCRWLSPCGYLDRRGEWWLLTTGGLHRLRSVDRLADLGRLPARAVYTRAGGLSDDVIADMFEDRLGNLWIGSADGNIAQWQRATETWRIYSELDGLRRSQIDAVASAFAEDGSGALWIGFQNGGVARLRDGRFEHFPEAENVLSGIITALLPDGAGRLWIATSQAGLVRIDDPGALQPTFGVLSTNSALASTNVRCLVEDAFGRIYAGTTRGIDRIDPATGRVTHFGAGEGLASEFVTAALRDRRGMLWFGTMNGVSRLDPAPPLSSRAKTDLAPVLISAIRVRGAPYGISELGEAQPASLTLSPDQNQLEIEFFSLAFDTGESLRFQYRIEDLDADWNRPTELRTVNYGRLPAGSHRLLIRSVRSDGALSTPAVVAFTILPPIYARWWFICVSVLLVGAAALALYRARVAQLLRVERVRARIATDLHDDIGASLSQIAILAEVARQRGAPARAVPTDPLERIAETSRTLVDSMSDIVWAVNPEVDSLADLVHRMRRFAEDTLNAADVELVFRAPGPADDLRLGADVRREIYLILKESVTNIAKHAAASQVAIDFERSRHRLRLRVNDNGRGFDPEERGDGNGIASMKRRVAALDGDLRIESAPGRGTTIQLEIRLAKA